MRFVSCIAVSSAAEEGNSGDIVLCECDLGEGSLPTNERELSDLVLRELVVSEGNEIHRRRNVDTVDLRVFAGSEEEKGSLKDQIWHELVKLLTGHRVKLESLNGMVEYTRWVCHATEQGNWFLVMELEAEGIVRKVAQLELQAVTEGEVDLFQMTSELFESYCKANDAAEAFRSRVSELETCLKERETLELLRQDRDDRTRSVMADLLNEKKARIAQLERQLEQKCSSPGVCDVSDSDVINRNVTAAVSQLISPGKRRARTEQMQDDCKRKKPRKSPSTEPKNESVDDFDDFQFFGITKVKEGTPNSNSTPKKVAVKQESHGEGLSENDSQISNTIVDSRSTIGAQSQSDTEADTETELAQADEPSSSSDSQSSSQSDTDVSS